MSRSSRKTWGKRGPEHQELTGDAYEGGSSRVGFAGVPSAVPSLLWAAFAALTLLGALVGIFQLLAPR